MNFWTFAGYRNDIEKLLDRLNFDKRNRAFYSLRGLKTKHRSTCSVAHLQCESLFRVFCDDD